MQLRFDALNSPALSPAIRARLAVLAGRRMTAAGVLVIAANRFRTQERNRADARERLAELIRAAAVAAGVPRQDPAHPGQQDAAGSRRRRPGPT